MSEFGGLWKHENNQHALVPLKTECAAQEVEELKTVTYATPLLWRNAGKKKKKKKS